MGAQHKLPEILQPAITKSGFWSRDPLSAECDYAEIFSRIKAREVKKEGVYASTWPTDEWVQRRVAEKEQVSTGL